MSTSEASMEILRHRSAPACLHQILSNPVPHELKGQMPSSHPATGADDMDASGSLTGSRKVRFLEFEESFLEGQHGSCQTGFAFDVSFALGAFFATCDHG